MVDKYIDSLRSVGLKITPQRLAIMEAIIELDNHPTAEMIIEYIRKKHPGIAIGTVYNVLGVLVDNNLIRKVKTEKDIMHYDGVLVHHHHLYCELSDRIEDFNDQDLDDIIRRYFQKKGIPDFEIQEIRLQIKGQFKDELE